MTVTVEVWELLSLIGAMIVGTATLIIYVESRFGKLVPTETYERKHEEIEKRIRRLEWWAAQQGQRRRDNDDDQSESD